MDRPDTFHLTWACPTQLCGAFDGLASQPKRHNILMGGDIGCAARVLARRLRKLDTLPLALAPRLVVSRAVCNASLSKSSCTDSRTILATPLAPAASSDRSTRPGIASFAPLARIESTNFSASGSGSRLMRSIFSATTTSPDCKSWIFRCSSGRLTRAPAAFSRYTPAT